MQSTGVRATLPDPMTPVLDIRDVAVAYRRGGPAVLDGVTLQVPPGTTLGVIGPNGAGKTTLLKVILGLVAPTRGTVAIAGQSPRAATRAGLVGYLPQSPRLAAHLPIDVRQLVTLGLAGRVGLLNAPSRGDLKFVDELLDRVGLAERRRTPIADLSGGTLQRALIARALASRPTLLLLDEPTVGVDARGQKAFVALLDELKRALNLTMLLVSHDLRAVTSISDRIACVSTRVHYHDVPQHLPAEVAYELFACDLGALGIDGVAAANRRRVPLTPLCDDPACDGHHLATTTTMTTIAPAPTTVSP